MNKLLNSEVQTTKLTDLIEPVEKIAVHAYVNNNLKMGNGKIIGQICHCIHYMTKKLEAMKTQSKCPKICERYDKWIADDYPIVVHMVPFDGLKELSTYAEATTVVDAGRTQIPANSMTVVGFYPNTQKGAQSDKDETNGDTVKNTNIKNYKFDGDDDQCAMYIFVNTDLKLSVDQMLHDSGLVTNYIIKSLENMKHQVDECPLICKKYQKWENEGCAKIVLKANTEQLNSLKLLQGSLFVSDRDTTTVVAFYPELKSIATTFANGFKLMS